MKLKFYAFRWWMRVLNSKNELLGVIQYDRKWKCHVWIQEPDIKMSESCLNQVLEKLKELDK